MSGLGPESSAIKVSKSLEERIAACSSGSEIQQLMREEMLRQGLVTVDPWNGDMIEVERPQPAGYAQTVVIDGKKTIVEGATELDLAKAVEQVYRAALSQPAAATTTRAAAVEQPRDTAGRFSAAVADRSDEAAAALEIARQAELELKFKRGDISASDYINQSGAIERHLAEQGIDIESLREVSSQRTMQSWVSATNQFKENHPDWQGGDANRDLLARIITENGWMDADPLQAIEAAYKVAVETNQITENPEVARLRRIASAKSPEEIRDILHDGRPINNYERA